MCVSGFRGRAEGGWAYKGQVAEEHSLLYSLINARRKDDGQPLSDLHICAQAFTFVLAGRYSPLFLVFMGVLCYETCQSFRKNAVRLVSRGSDLLTDNNLSLLALAYTRLT